MPTYDQAMKGRLREDDIGEDDICDDNEAYQCSTWYFSGYALNVPILFPKLVIGAFRQWSKFIANQEFIQAISFAMEGIDKDFLTAIGFTLHFNSPPKGELPIYCRTFNTTDLEEIASSIEKKYKAKETD